MRFVNWSQRGNKSSESTFVEKKKINYVTILNCLKFYQVKEELNFFYLSTKAG